MRKQIIILAAITLIAIGICLLIPSLLPKVKAETPAVDPEKTFLQTFAQGGIKGYQITTFDKYAVWVDGQGIYNVAGELNGNWTVISKLQLTQPTPTP